MRKKILSILLVLFSFNAWFFLQSSQPVHAKTLGVRTTLFQQNFVEIGIGMVIE